MSTTFRTQRFGLLVIATALLLWGCGGGGSSDEQSSINNVPPTINQVATVTLLLTDAPSDAFDEILVTLSSIELLGNGDPVILFEGTETVDLLRLENFSDLFAVSDAVPVGSYNKIRLRVDDIELITLDDMGAVIESIRPDIPANGKIDLNPRDDIEIEPGDDIVLQLDIDARHSIHVTGNGRYKFRPVVFVETLDQDFNGKAVRINGEIESVDEVNSAFDICQSSPSSADSDSDSDSDSDVDVDDDDSDEEECVTISTNADTGFFDNEAQSAAFADLMPGDTVMVIGDYTGGAEAMFEATVVAINTEQMFEQFEGYVQTEVDADNRFTLLLDSGQGFSSDTIIDVEVQDGTAIADEEGNALDTSYIQPDLEAEVDGLILLSDTDPDVLRAIYIALEIGSDDGDMDEEEIRISGGVLSVDEATNSLMVATDVGDRCVVLDDDADIFLITTVDDVSTTEAITLSDVSVDAVVDVYGEERIDGCVEASTILVL